MIQIAVYGKGGIGKSTISANLSYQLAGRGHKVAQIGCDPKHDSTRLLLGGHTQPTILDHIDSGSKDGTGLISTGSNGVICMEAGGPEPGVGCAGRGILTAFDFIERENAIPDADIVVYDVLGDVVCGGFAVPLRRKYADLVFIVTSGEFMSLYAANNILKGVRNYDGTEKRMGGLILNSRGNDGEYQYVKNFADAVGLPIVATVPRDGAFSEAESRGMTVSQMDPDCRATKAVSSVADAVEEVMAGTGERYAASPVDDATLDLIAKGVRVPRSAPAPSRLRCPNIRRGKALQGCGVRAAFYMFMNIEDSDVIIHGPSSCLSMFASVEDYMHLACGEWYRKPVDERAFSTDLKDISAIYGGMEPLRNLIEERIASGTRTIFVATACVPGIIGDDVVGVCSEAERDHPGVRVVPCICDGVLNGGGADCRAMATRALAGCVDMGIEPVHGTVNLLGYGPSSDPVARRNDDTFRIFDLLGLEVNCVYLCDSSMDDIAGLRRGSINVLAEEATSVRIEAGILEETCGIPFYPDPMPRGITATLEWTAAFGRRMGVSEDRIREAIDGMREEYRELSEPLKGALEGRRALVQVPMSMDIGWMTDIADLIGLEIVEIDIPTISVWSHSRQSNGMEDRFRIMTGMDPAKMRERVEELKPDLVLGANRYLSTYGVPYLQAGTGVAGYRGCLDAASRLVRICRMEGLRWLRDTTDS